MFYLKNNNVFSITHSYLEPWLILNSDFMLLACPGMCYYPSILENVRVKSGKFGHQVNSDTHFANSGNPDETAPYEPSHQDFHCLLS